MTTVSRPLRALGITLGGWIMMRIVALWPAGSSAVSVPSIDMVRAAVPVVPIVSMPLDNDVPLFVQRAISHRSIAALRSDQHTKLVRQMAAVPTVPRVVDQSQIPSPVPNTARFAETPNAIAPGLPATSAAYNRFSGSAWSLMRGDSAPSLASGGQLGGSQIGMRLFYTPGPEPWAITARISSPLSQPTGREAAIGLALRGRNVGIIAEQRFSLDKGGRNAPVVFAYGGVSDVKLPGGIRLDGYAQAGVVGFKRPAAFVDGAIRLERTILRADKSSLGIGAGAWGGAQPGASRLDIGPQIVARIAAPDTNLRVSAEWRQRVAGNAAPASGPSVTVGFDF